MDKEWIQIREGVHGVHVAQPSEKPLSVCSNSVSTGLFQMKRSKATWIKLQTKLLWFMYLWRMRTGLPFPHLVLCLIMKLYVVMTSPGFSGSSRWMLTPPTEITLFLSSLMHVEGPEEQRRFIKRLWISVIYFNEHHILHSNGRKEKENTFFLSSGLPHECSC